MGKPHSERGAGFARLFHFEEEKLGTQLGYQGFGIVHRLAGRTVKARSLQYEAKDAPYGRVGVHNQHRSPVG